MSILLQIFFSGTGSVGSEPGGTSELPAARSEQTAYLIAIGDSITGESYAGAGNSYARFIADNLGGVSYIPYGHNGWTTTQLLTVFQAEAIDTMPSILPIMAGINDLDDGDVSIVTVLSNLQNMISQALAGGVPLIVWLPITPISKPSFGRYVAANADIDTCNAEMITHIESLNNPKVMYVDHRNLLCEHRIGDPEGTRWQLKAAYNFDGVHLNGSGNEDLGALVANAIINR